MLGKETILLRKLVIFCYSFPFILASRDFVILSVDGTRVIENRLGEDKLATSLSILDHYKNRPRTANFDSITLLDFAKTYTMPRVGEMNHRIEAEKL